MPQTSRVVYLTRVMSDFTIHAKASLIHVGLLEKIAGILTQFTALTW